MVCVVKEESNVLQIFGASPHHLAGSPEFPRTTTQSVASSLETSGKLGCLSRGFHALFYPSVSKLNEAQCDGAR